VKGVKGGFETILFLRRDKKRKANNSVRLLLVYQYD